MPGLRAARGAREALGGGFERGQVDGAAGPLRRDARRQRRVEGAQGAGRAPARRAAADVGAQMQDGRGECDGVLNGPAAAPRGEGLLRMGFGRGGFGAVEEEGEGVGGYRGGVGFRGCVFWGGHCENGKRNTRRTLVKMKDELSSCTEEGHIFIAPWKTVVSDADVIHLSYKSHCKGVHRC